MAIPSNQTIANGNLYQISSNTSLNIGPLVNNAIAAIPGVGNAAFVASPQIENGNVAFSTVGNNTRVSYSTANGPVTIQNVSLVSEGSTGFTFNSGNDQFFFSNAPITSTAAIDLQSNNPLVNAIVEPLVGPDPVIYVGANNIPSQLNGQPYVACFVRGTHVQTEDGERRVEDLRIGDRVLTADGAFKPVLWIGTRSYSGAFIAGNRKALPVCVRAGALGENQPSRDLHLSPCHALLIDGLFVPAGHLVNGVTVVQAHSVESVDYFHIELEEHDAILVEGVAAETFVDDDSRMSFQNAEEYYALYPDRIDVEAVFAAPRVEDGEELAMIRERLMIRAGTLIRRAA